MSKIPNPGSDEAVDMGCICPVLDNDYGNGLPYLEGAFWITQGCPIHAPDIIEEEEDET
jgi:hypothetical protein